MEVWIIVATILVITVCAISIVIRKLLRDTARSVFGTNTLKQGLDQQADLLAKTPKSISSMTKIYLPQIQNDFPEFNLTEFKQKSDNMIKSAFLAISNQRISILEGASADLQKQVELTIQNDIQNGQITNYEDVVVHQTEITRYTKSFGLCVITLQSAIEHITYVTSKAEIISGTDQRTLQTRYNIELVYVQDEELANLHSKNKAVTGAKCPSCGANITALGQKQCEFCGTAIKEVNIHAWQFNKFFEVPTNIV